MVSFELPDEAERPVVERFSRDGHVVGVHHAVDEAERLPPGDRLRGPLRHGPKKQSVSPGAAAGKFGEAALHRAVGQQGDVFSLSRPGKNLERAEAHVRSGDAKQHGRRFRSVPLYLLVASDHGEGSRRRDSETEDGLASQVLPYAGAKRRAPVEPSRKRGPPASLEMQVPLPPPPVAKLSQEKRAPVAEARVPDPELVSPVAHGRGPRAPKEPFPAEILGEQRVFSLPRVYSQALRQALVPRRQARALERLGAGFDQKRRREPRAGDLQAYVAYFLHGAGGGADKQVYCFGRDS